MSMDDLSDNMLRMIEIEVDRRVRERLASEAGLQLHSRTDIEQPGWYGTIRRRFGWPRWRHVPYERKLFLVAFGTMLQNKAIDRFRGGLNLFCDILEPFVNSFKECVGDMPCECRDMIQDDDFGDTYGVGCGVTMREWHRLVALYEKLAPHRRPKPEGL